MRTGANLVAAGIVLQPPAAPQPPSTSGEADQMREQPKSDWRRLATKPESWISEPSRHVLIHEVPALPYQATDGFFFHQWHYPSGSVTTRDLKNLSKKAVAPLLFVGGNVNIFNLKQHFRSTIPFIAEPTPDRIWYKAKE